jgi:hypothetical protein
MVVYDALYAACSGKTAPREAQWRV